jgi:hypothetical protein
MARKGKVAVSITADNSGLKRGVRDAEGDLGRLQRVGVSSTRGLSAGFKAAGGVLAGAAVADQIRQTIVAAQESQVSQRKLAAQLKATGISYQAHAKEIDNVIQKTSKLSGLDDEDLQDSFTNIVRATGSVKDGLRGTAIAADLARAKHMDVARAGDVVAKAFNGNVGALKRMGVTLQPVTAAQDKLKASTKNATVEQVKAAKEQDRVATGQKAIAELQRRVAGQAQAYGKTSAGAQDRFRVAVENLRESVGAKLLPILTKVTTKAADFVNQMTDGTGAGGRFAAKLKDIADRIRPIVKFFTDHPKIVAIAVGAWVAYRIAAAAAMAATRLKALGMFKGLVRPAAVAGTEAGTAFGTAASTAGGAAMRRGKWAAIGSGLGGAIGAAATVAFVAEISVGIARWLKKQPWYKPPGGAGGFLDSLIPDSLLPHKLPQKPKAPKAPNRSTQSPFTPSTPLGKLPSAASQAPDNRPRAHTSSVMAHAATATAAAVRAAPTAHAASGAGVYGPSQLASLWVSAGGNPASADIAAAVAMAESGGRSSAENHNTNGSIDRGLWQINSVHGALSTFDVRGNAKAAVSISGNGRNWSPWVTYQTGAYRQFLGRAGKMSAGSVTAGVSGGARAPSVAPKRPKITTAALEHGQSGVPKGMGTTFPKGVTGFQPGLTDSQIADLTADPETNQKARNMRLFQLGVRRNKIISDLRSGKVRNPATRQRLLDELRGIDSEMSGLAKPIDTSDTATPDAPDTSATDAAAAAEQERTDAIKANTDALQAVKDELRKQNDFASQVTSVSLGQAWRAIADMVSGQIAGVGYDGRAATAGAGALSRY